MRLLASILEGRKIEPLLASKSVKHAPQMNSYYATGCEIIFGTAVLVPV